MACGDNAACDSVRITLFAVLADYLCKPLLRIAVYNVISRQSLALVHAHVERRVFHVRKSALGIVNLIGRNTEVYGRSARAHSPEYMFYFAEIAVFIKITLSLYACSLRDAASIASRSRSSAISRPSSSFSTISAACPPPPTGTIDVNTVGVDVKPGDTFFGHYRFVSVIHRIIFIKMRHISTASPHFVLSPMHEAVGGLPLCSFLHLLEAKLYHKSFHSRGIGRLQVLLPKRLVPKFDMVAGADNFDAFLQTCILAQTRGYEYPATSRALPRMPMNI